MQPFRASLRREAEYLLEQKSFPTLCFPVGKALFLWRWETCRRSYARPTPREKTVHLGVFSPARGDVQKTLAIGWSAGLGRILCYTYWHGFILVEKLLFQTNGLGNKISALNRLINKSNTNRNRFGKPESGRPQSIIEPFSRKSFVKKLTRDGYKVLWVILHWCAIFKYNSMFLFSSTTSLKLNRSDLVFRLTGFFPVIAQPVHSAK